MMIQAEINVLTSGPHGGKTTLCQELKKMGYDTIREASRDVIMREMKKPNPITPVTNLYEFQKLVLNLQLAREKRARGTAFADCGIICNLAYCLVGGIDPPRELVEAVDRHVERGVYKRVFFLEQVPNYKKDAARWEDESTSLLIHHHRKEVYGIRGFELIHIPVMATPRLRAEMIVDIVESQKVAGSDVLYRP